MSLELARDLISLGAPVFAMPPCRRCSGDGCAKDQRHPKGQPACAGGYVTPTLWQTFGADPRRLEVWRDGYALAMVCGKVFDVVDTDKQNDGHLEGGRDSLTLPTVWLEVETASGGTHEYIAAQGLPKTKVAPGVDYQAGDDDGQGVGFVFLPGTKKTSKTTGMVGADYLVKDRTRFDVLLRAGTGVARVLLTRDPEWRARVQGIKSAGRSERVGSVRAAGASPAGKSDRWASVVVEADAPVPKGEHDNALTAYAALLRAHGADADEATRLMDRKIAAMVDVGDYDDDWATGKLASAWEKFDAPCDCDNPFCSAPVKTARAEEAGRPVERVPVVRPTREEVVAAQVVLEDLEAAPEARKEAEEVVARADPFGFRARLIRSEDVRSMKSEMRPLIHGWLNFESIAWLVGPPKTLKSFIALDMACHVALGRAWQGCRVVKDTVLYVFAEGKSGIPNRLRAWEKTHNSDEPVAGIHLLPVAVQAGEHDGVSVQWDDLTEIVRELNPGLVIIDTQARSTVGLEENSATDMGVYIAAVSQLKEANTCCVLTVHHHGKSGEYRGSSAIFGALDTMLEVQREDNTVTLVGSNQKELEEGLELAFDMVFVELGVSEFQEPITSIALKGVPVSLKKKAKGVEEINTDLIDRRIIAAIKNGATSGNAIHEQARGTRATCLDRVQALIECGILKREGRKISLTDPAHRGAWGGEDLWRRLSEPPATK